MSQDTYEMPKDGWVCFHCGERFTKPGAAKDHFGTYPDREPACIIKAGDERGLVMALRKAEDRATELFQMLEKERQEHEIELEKFRGLQHLAKIDGLREALDQSVLDISYYIHLATKVKTNNKWIDCEIYKLTMSLERLEKARAYLAAQEG